MLKRDLKEGIACPAATSLSVITWVLHNGYCFSYHLTNSEGISLVAHPSYKHIFKKEILRNVVTCYAFNKMLKLWTLFFQISLIMYVSNWLWYFAWECVCTHMHIFLLCFAIKIVLFKVNWDGLHRSPWSRLFEIRYKIVDSYLKDRLNSAVKPPRFVT